MTTKFIFVTGGVVSSLGKGIMASSVGQLLKKQGFKVTMQKFDPYINVNPGLLSPSQHGEVFVTDDGSETDLDLGHYERFLDENLNQESSVTTGQIYARVIEKEKSNAYKGATIQVIPHITDEIKQKLISVAKSTKADIVITEIGGTVGDIESLPFLEAIRQARKDFGYKNTLYIHTTLVPFLKAAKEIKTKPTQHSVKELMSLGIAPDMLVLRSEMPFDRGIKEKISSFCDVKKEMIFESVDVEIIYQMILNLKQQKIDTQILKHFRLYPKQQQDLSEWKELINKIESLQKTVKIAVIGRHISFHDAYLSVNEALKHAGYQQNRNVEIKWLDSTKINAENVGVRLKDVQGVLIPGGFGQSGIEGKLQSIKFARENNIPFLGICLGMQLALVEFAKNVINIKKATSKEFHPYAKNPIIDYLKDGKTEKKTGLHKIKIKPKTLAVKLYQTTNISERFRHNYEFNLAYEKEFLNKGLVFSGYNQNGGVEIMENPENDFFVGVQYHPEYLSRPLRPHPLFIGFIKAVKKFQNS